MSEADRRKYGCDLTSARSMYYYRARMLEVFANYDVKFWETGYPFWLESPLRCLLSKRHAAELEKSKAFNAAKIVLNTMHFGEIEGVDAAVRSGRLRRLPDCGVEAGSWRTL